MAEEVVGIGDAAKALQAVALGAIWSAVSPRGNAFQRRESHTDERNQA
jgi:hypothetical protein